MIYTKFIKNGYNHGCKKNELQAVRREHLEETAIELAVVTAELRASVKKIQVTVLMDVQQDGRLTFATKVHTS